jgi:NodT family efflux transporter outer membrane factor (OMF) lipoprotein
MPACRLASIVGAAFFLSGCAVGPDYVAPDVPLPASLSGPSSPALRGPSSTGASSDATPPAEITRWWLALRDPQLNSLIERAVVANPDIEIALTHIQAAREQEIVVLGAALPGAGAVAGAALGSGTNRVKSRVPNSLNSAINGTGIGSVVSVAGFDSTWELDLFGKYRRLLEAAHDQTEAAIEVRNAVIITVIAEVARNYIELRGLQARAAVVRDNIVRAEKTVDLVQTRLRQGISNELIVIIAKRELATLQAQLPPLIAGITDAESRIAVLLGTYSENIVSELRRPRKIPHTPERVRAGQPVDLLRRRPDIRWAERELASATTLIGAAIADLFPRAGVSAGVGAQGQSGDTRTAFQGPIWSLGPTAYWPILDFGRLDALINIQEFAAHGLLVNYQKTIVAAVADVEQAIKRYKADIEQLHRLDGALAEARRAVQVSTERFEREITDFLYVLDAQRQEYAVRDQHVAAQAAVAVQFVALYKALGGGWELYQALPPIPPPQPAIIAAIRRLATPQQTDR